jgi:NADP-dependent 3-hydroxy acid dehydrogenase YdfG
VSAVTLIIGAGPGVGAATARRFAREGHEIGLIARNPERLEALGEQLRAEGATVGWVSADVTNAAELTTAIHRFVERTGRLDVVHFNPSAYRPGAARDLTAADLLTDLAIGTAPLCTVVGAALPLLLEQRTGTILVTGSGAAEGPRTDAPSLGAQKAALRSLVETLAADLGPEGIHVGTVTVYGDIRPGTPFAAERVADHLWELAAETVGDPSAWRTIVELRG